MPIADDPSEVPPNPAEEAKDSKAQGSESLTPEEQMEQFEESLKESDWGHQPC